ncbi:MAG: hypothetical protein JWM47_3618 [Acidimicrobiales bacterium]|nr:hypothetical protein [Acidimicrobiales bacterium]
MARRARRRWSGREPWLAGRGPRQGRDRTRSAPAARLIVAIAGLALLTGCQRWVWTVNGTEETGSDAPRLAVLTPDRSDRYAFRATARGVQVTAPRTNSGQNLRVVFWRPGSPVGATSQTCATWSSQAADGVQQGAALRIRVSPGRVRAITVTKNIWQHATWGFNFHTWDSDRPQPWQHFGGVEVENLRSGRQVKPLPWRFCARIRDRSVEVKVWPTDRAEPAWGDPAWGGSKVLPAGWEAPGVTGWFIGHLPPGGTATLDNLATWRRDAMPPSRARPPSDARPTPG